MTSFMPISSTDFDTDLSYNPTGYEILGGKEDRSEGAGEEEDGRIGAFHLEGRQSAVRLLDPLGAQGQPPRIQRVRRVRSKTGKKLDLLSGLLSWCSSRF